MSEEKICNNDNELGIGQVITSTGYWQITEQFLQSFRACYFQCISLYQAQQLSLKSTYSQKCKEYEITLGFNRKKGNFE